MSETKYIVEPDADKLKACFNHFAALGLEQVLLLPFYGKDPVRHSFHFKTCGANGKIIPPSEELMRIVYPSWEFQNGLVRTKPEDAWIQIDIENMALLISHGLWRREQWTDEQRSDRGGKYLPIDVRQALAIF